MSTKKFVVVFLFLAVAILGMNSLFIVNEMQRAVLLEFGAVKRSDIEPGLHLKWPFINDVRKFDGRVRTSDAPPERFLTLEKKAVIGDSFAKFRVRNVPTYYTATSGDEGLAEQLLKQRINTGLRNEISKRTLHEVVSGERDQLMQVLTTELNEVARLELGVAVIDVRVKRIDLPPEVSQSVYDRMNTERDIEAREHRAKGQELAVGIRADAEKQRDIILADAYSTSEQIRGEGDAQAASIYASAFTRDKEFYKFYRSMNAYKKSFSSKSDVLLIDTDSDYFKYMNNSGQN